MKPLTPAMRQYQKIKREYPDAILFFRMGDFYEMFFEDARLASRLLDIALTSRDKGKGPKTPMCGIPYHAADIYISRLIKNGYKVAICEQVEDPRTAKGIVKREVVRVITPGTALDTHLLDPKENNYIASLFEDTQGFGVSFLDLSTGEFKATEFPTSEGWNKLIDEFNYFSPRELLIPENFNLSPKLKEEFAEMIISPLEGWLFAPDYGYQLLLEQFKTASLEPFGIEGNLIAIGAAGALLHYLRETQKEDLAHITGLSFYQRSDYMILDAIAQRNLELTRSLQEGKREGSLLSIIDLTVTGMGARLLKSWLLKPLLNKPEIDRRLDAVEELHQGVILRASIREELKEFHDMERLTSKVTLNTANARDLVSLKNSVTLIPALRELLKGCSSSFLKELTEELDELTDIGEIIDKAIVEEPPLTLREGGLIKGGFDERLDELREISRKGKSFIARLEARERKRTGISTLKVRYNKVFGYYIEVSKANLSLVPDDYMRKQTLVGGERFITPELKDYESRVLGAEEEIRLLEYEIFNRIREKVSEAAPRILTSARRLAIIDVLTALAEVAARNSYNRPVITEGEEITIIEGRHPVVEKTNLAEKFIPNDTYLNPDSDQLLIITGPNMGGKSTYLRQVALIAIMAQMGAFVPAKRAEIGLIDRIFIRIGALDNIVRGQSTFLVEMNETASILYHATRKSLILLDEVGRGTSTFDGVSIAWAVAESIHNNPSIAAKTLFATHYHELADLARTLPKAKNYNVSVREWNDRIIFLRKVVEGCSDKSYGIQVARLAGIPREVIERAKEILQNLEKNELDAEGIPKLARGKRVARRARNEHQLLLFGPEDHPIVQRIRKLDISKMTPLEALSLLNDLQKGLK
ncbi:DNA mismatch repair protein MutS [bacterium (candidate division B38) B3_B38]|nr:MAG: DNA mismatch repair protein MutS [bacterium (candidate division B38) B3_B38]